MDIELYKTLTTLSQKRVEALILIGVLLILTWRKYSANKNGENSKTVSTICIASFFIEISFAIPIALNLSFQKDGPGSIILQSFITISGGLVVLLGYIENRRKNDIDESKNLDEKIQKLHTSRHERNMKSIEVMFSSNTPAAMSAVYSLCNIADEWANESINSESEDELNSHKEAQSIINVLCTYIRECGKEQENPPQQEIYNKLVCKTILEELSNRLNILDKGYSNWNSYKINLRGTTFTFPVELKNIGNTNNIDISGCTFNDDLVITVAVDKNIDTESNESGPRTLSLEGCTFNSSVSIVGNGGAEISELNLQNTHFKEKSRLEVCHLSFKDSPSPSTGEPSTYSIYIYGTQPHEMIFSYLSNAAIVVGMKYEERIAGNYEEELDYQEIPGNIKIKDCPETSIKISDKHFVSGKIDIDCPSINIEGFTAKDCILNGKITISAGNIYKIILQETYIYHGLNVDCRGKIWTFYGPDSVFLYEGSANILQIPFIDLVNTKSNVEITAKSINFITIDGSHFYTPFTINTVKIDELSFFKTVFHTLVNINKNIVIKEGNFKFCSAYDRVKKIYRNFNPQNSPSIQGVTQNREINSRTKKIADTISVIALTFGLISK